MYLDMRKKL